MSGWIRVEEPVAGGVLLTSKGSLNQLTKVCLHFSCLVQISRLDIWIWLSGVTNWSGSDKAVWPTALQVWQSYVACSFRTDSGVHPHMSGSNSAVLPAALNLPSSVSRSSGSNSTVLPNSSGSDSTMGLIVLTQQSDSLRWFDSIAWLSTQEQRSELKLWVWSNSVDISAAGKSTWTYGRWSWPKYECQESCPTFPLKSSGYVRRLWCFPRVKGNNEVLLSAVEAGCRILFLYIFFSVVCYASYRNSRDQLGSVHWINMQARIPTYSTPRQTAQFKQFTSWATLVAPWWPF